MNDITPKKHPSIKCCNQLIWIWEGIEFNGSQGIGLSCDICNQSTAGKDLQEAEKAFTPVILKESVKPMSNNQSNLPAVRNLDSNKLMEIASPVIGDQSALQRLVKNNLRYVENLKGDSWNKIWNTNPDSIIHATEEAMILGAELGKMGDLIPYGSTCEFIPSIEAYEFSLTNGKNAPFENIEILVIHENDTSDIGIKDGDFYCDNKMGIPRGEVAGVAVYGRFKDGTMKGEFYDVERLMKKAEEHSTSYQYYLQDLRSFDALKAEGKTEIENGREFFNKTMNGKNGTWTKKVFRDELTNPYAGADKPEMMRKMAGKTFCRKFARVRNAEAAMNEVKSHKEAVNRALDMADDIIGDFE